MGIAKLAELLKDEAPDAVRAVPLCQYRDRVVAVDASVAMCQFLTAMPEIINRNGQNISSLRGLFYRTLHLLEKGIKPVFVFDGQPPDRKLPLLLKRAAAWRTRKQVAASAPGKTPQLFLRQDAETLLRYLGVPCVQAPAEAEATCAALVKSGHAWCIATEDMDALPLGSERLMRHLNVKNRDVEEISLPVVLQKLGMTHEQFVDLCILLGCDYCGTIQGIGPKKALKLLRQHGTIEQILQHICPQKHPLPDNWNLEETRRLFLQPEVAETSQLVLQWQEPDREALVQFLAHEKHMDEQLVCRRLQRWQEARLKYAQDQALGPKTVESPKKAKMTDFYQAKKRQPKKPPTKSSRKKRGPPAETPEVAGDSALGT